MKNKNIILIIVLLLLIIVPVSAFIIDQHVTISRESLSKTQTSPITQEILQYEDYFYLGNILTDISVVYYFTVDDEEGDNFIDKLFKVFSFSIGKKYRATHSTSLCNLALNKANNQKERVVAYGICAHLLQDAVSHQFSVPLAIKQTKLTNGMIHSIKEIREKNEFATHQDFVLSRQVLDLAYEMTPYFERILVDDSAFSNIKIPEMIDFFVKQVQPEGEYKLGFRSFFALPTYIYWIILILFLISIALVGLTIRKMRDKQINILTIFTLIISLVLLGLVSTAIYGLVTGNIWLYWERLSQFLFSPSMYVVGAGTILVSIFILFNFIISKDKKNKIPNVLVGIFLLLISVWFMSLPTSLDTGNGQQLHDLAVQNTVNMLNNGITEVLTVGDPVGFNALKEADEHGKGQRSLVMITLLVLLALIIFFTFKKKKK